VPSATPPAAPGCSLSWVGPCCCPLAAPVASRLGCPPSAAYSCHRFLHTTNHLPPRGCGRRRPSCARRIPSPHPHHPLEGGPPRVAVRPPPLHLPITSTKGTLRASPRRPGDIPTPGTTPTTNTQLGSLFIVPGAHPGAIKVAHRSGGGNCQRRRAVRSAPRSAPKGHSLSRVGRRLPERRQPGDRPSPEAARKVATLQASRAGPTFCLLHFLLSAPCPPHCCPFNRVPSPTALVSPFVGHSAVVFLEQGFVLPAGRTPLRKRNGRRVSPGIASHRSHFLKDPFCYSRRNRPVACRRRPCFFCASRPGSNRRSPGDIES